MFPCHNMTRVHLLGKIGSFIHMAKKKKTSRKKQRQLKKQLQYDLLGILFLLLAFFGSGAPIFSDGFIPQLLANIFRFFFGVWYFIIPIAFIVLGIYIIMKKALPAFFTRHTIGFFILFAGILLITHTQALEKLLAAADGSVVRLTWDNYLAYVKGTGVASQIGGGMIGACLLAMIRFLFSMAGAKIIAIAAIVIGFLFMTTMSLGTIITKLRERTAVATEKAKEKRQDRKEKAQAKKAQQKEETIIDAAPEKEALPEMDVQYAYAENGQMEIPVHKDEPANKASEESEDDDPSLEEISFQEKENDAYILPPIDLLNEPAVQSQHGEQSNISKTAKLLEQTFESFGVKAKITAAHVGPAVTKYEVLPEAGVKVSRILNLTDDLALALAAQDIRIEAPIPGKSAVGIEVPNKETAMVSLREVLNVHASQDKKLLFALGKDISGTSIVGELNKMPHILIAGATGSGKSVCINGIITSILMRAKPHEVKMMMIDPKKVELNVYNGIPHLLAPVVTDPKKASIALRKVIAEMEHRYELFSDTGTRNMEGYNQFVAKEGPESRREKLPYIVVLVDELADLMMVASKDVEDSITRLAQMARAAGIHLIIATQRPSVDVITGIIKANIPSRIAFSVSSQVDSRTILDTGGAEKLLGKGDMLYIPVGMSKPTRVQGAFLSDEEVERVVNHCVEQQKAQYKEEMIPEEEPEQAQDEVDDEYYYDAVDLVVDMQTASVSMLQRRFRIGYTRAARLIDMMEDRGIVGPYEGNKPRVVLLEKNAAEEESISENN